MAQTQGTFATVLGCMDGRSVVAITEFLKDEYNVDYPDMVTAPGIDKTCAAMPEGEKAEYQRRVVAISVNHHGSRVVVVSGHDDCAGNPVSADEHAEHIKKGVEEISYWEFPDGTTILGLWVAPNADGKWVVNVLEKRSL